VDGQIGLLHGRQNDYLKQIAGAIRPDDQPAVGFFAGIFDGKGMIGGVEDVLVGDAMLTRRSVDLHKISVLRKGWESERRQVRPRAPFGVIESRATLRSEDEALELANTEVHAARRERRRHR